MSNLSEYCLECACTIDEEDHTLNDGLCDECKTDKQIEAHEQNLYEIKVADQWRHR